MGKYIARRTLLVIPVLFIVSVITFSIMQLAPGDPAAIVLGGDYIMYATAEEIEEVRIIWELIDHLLNNILVGWVVFL